MTHAIDRRTFLITASAAVAILAGPAFTPTAARAQSAAASAVFIEQTAQRLVDVVNGPGSIESKKPKMTTVIDSAVDVDSVARFCLGRFWTVATSEQREQYLKLFHAVLVNNITSKLGDYVGVKITVGRATAREDADLVDSVVERPNNPPANVSWLVSRGTPRIIDVIAEGTSLRLTQRQDYASYLAHNGGDVGKLIEAMRDQATRGS